MGMGYRWECSKCNYSFDGSVGFGFLYPKVYEGTLEKAKAGELGEELKELLSVYPNAVINPEIVILQCSVCGEYDSGPILTSYVPKEGVEVPREDGRMWSSAFPFYGASYVTSDEMEKYYDLFSMFDHRCQKCGGKMVVVPHDCYEKPNGMTCPKCKSGK